MSVKKIIVAAALVMSLAVIGCNDDKATPEPTTQAEAVESMAAEAVDAIESITAEVVDAAATDAVESMAAEVVDAVASPAS